MDAPAAGAVTQQDTPRAAPPVLGVLDQVDRDGHVRQSHPIHAWPLRLGRALDNDIVLADPHVAAHHAVIDAAEPGADAGPTLRVADTRNGVLLGPRRLRSGEQAALPTRGEPIDLMLGRTALRLRLPDHTLAPELALAPVGSAARRSTALVGAALLLVASVLFATYLETDPEGFARAAGSALLGSVVGAAVWCTVWALLSKTFTRQAHFGWHLRVFLLASLALVAVTVLPALGAFALSWPWLTDFDFIAVVAVGATGLYFHLLAVEPARHRLLKWVAVTCAVVGMLLSVWFNVQRIDQFGDELYMSHLFPPALRLAKPVPVAAFVDDLASLKVTLDRKAREPARGGDDAPSDDQ